jgi:hypothetical protein
MDYVVAFVILLPLNIVILVSAMIFSSYLAGGIEFGSLSGVLVKGTVLLAVISSIELIPYGQWPALIFWWLGLMYLFRLDFWEARLLVLVNWGLSTLCVIFIVVPLLRSM